MNERREVRNDINNNPRPKPTEELVHKLHEVISAIPSEVDDNIIFDTLDSIISFTIHFDYDLFHTLSPPLLQSLLNLIPFLPNRKRSDISSHTVTVFTFFLKYSPLEKIVDDFNEIDLFNIIISNMYYVIDPQFYTSCILLLYEALRIKKELRDEFVQNDVHSCIIRCSPYPDKIFFEFLTLLILEPVFSQELAYLIVPTFIAQEVPMERTITVLKCITSIIETDKSIISPIIQSDFLERTVSSLTSSSSFVVHTIAQFFKFSSIVLKDNGQQSLSVFQKKINICDILKLALNKINGGKKEMSFADMMISALKTEKTSNIATCNDKLLLHACNLMNILIGFGDQNVLTSLLGWIPDINFSSFLSEGLPYKSNVAITRFLINFALIAPLSFGRRVINNNSINFAFTFAASDGEENEPNDFAKALAALALRYHEDKEIIELMSNINNEFENVSIDYSSSSIQ